MNDSTDLRSFCPGVAVNRLLGNVDNFNVEMLVCMYNYLVFNMLSCIVMWITLCKKRF